MIRVSTADDCKLLQFDINYVARWVRGLGLELSFPKSRTMIFIRSYEAIMLKYSVHDSALKYYGDCVIDLGISFDRSWIC